MDNIIKYFPDILSALGETLYMSLGATLFAYILGLPMGAVLTVTKKGGLKPNILIYKALDIIINIVRSAPFLILLIAVIPLTRAIVGTSLGSTATIVPLVIASAPFVARCVEGSLNEVDYGVVEASQSMGACPFKIVTRVLIPEAKPSLISGATVTVTNVLGYSAMAGAVGGGGLGDFAINYGFRRYDTVLMLFCLALLIIIVQVIQLLGTAIQKASDKRR